MHTLEIIQKIVTRSVFFSIVIIGVIICNNTIIFDRKLYLVDVNQNQECTYWLVKLCTVRGLVEENSIHILAIHSILLNDTVPYSYQ